MLHRLFAYHLAALVLLTNVGVPVFTHVCHGQGKVWSSVVLPMRTCCGKQKAAKSVASCHAKTPTLAKCGHGIQSKPCCENRIGFLKSQSEFFNPLPYSTAKALQPISVAVPPNTLALDFSSFSSSVFSFQPHAPPVPLHGRSLLVFKQVFRC